MLSWREIGDVSLTSPKDSSSVKMATVEASWKKQNHFKQYILHFYYFEDTKLAKGRLEKVK